MRKLTRQTRSKRTNGDEHTSKQTNRHERIKTNKPTNTNVRTNERTRTYKRTNQRTRTHERTNELWHEGVSEQITTESYKEKELWKVIQPTNSVEETEVINSLYLKVRFHSLLYFFDVIDFVNLDLNRLQWLPRKPTPRRIFSCAGSWWSRTTST